MDKQNSCQCEHASHFDGKNHKYGIKSVVIPVKTEYGTFHVCKKCADTCYKQYKKNPRKRIRKSGTESRFVMRRPIRATQKTAIHRKAYKTLKRVKPRKTNASPYISPVATNRAMHGVFIVQAKYIGRFAKNESWKFVASFGKKSDAIQYAHAYHKFIPSEIRVIHK